MGTKRLGRPPSALTPHFHIREPDETMKALAGLKNEGFTWQEITDYLCTHRPKISKTTVWKVAKGIMRSKDIDIALGLKKAPKPRPRVSVPTNNCAAAVKKLTQYYSQDEILRFLAQAEKNHDQVQG
jgi:hypothetical protein